MAVALRGPTLPAIHVRFVGARRNPVRRAPASARDAVTARMPDRSPRRHRRSPSPGSGIRHSRSRAVRSCGKAPPSSRCPETPERRRVPPDLRQRPVADRPELQAGNGFGGVARQHAAGGGDVQRAACPAAHAGLRPARIVVRDDEVDHQPSADSAGGGSPSPALHARPARAWASAPRGCATPSHNIAHGRFPPALRRATQPFPRVRRRGRYWHGGSPY